VSSKKMTAKDKHLTVRLTTPVGCSDDFRVFWHDAPIGRIMKATGFPSLDARWSWVISLPEGARCGTGDNRADCEAKLRRTFALIRRDLPSSSVRGQ